MRTWFLGAARRQSSEPEVLFLWLWRRRVIAVLRTGATPLMLVHCTVGSL